MRLTYFIVIFAIITMLSACAGTNSNKVGYPRIETNLYPPKSLTPAPVGNVVQDQLPAADDQNSLPETPTSDNIDLQQLASNAQDFTKEELIGRWTLTFDGQQCNVFLSLTKWARGYRAASKGCPGQAVLISGWMIEEQKIILADNIGTNIAYLYKTALEQYTGSSSDGEIVSMGR